LPRTGKGGKRAATPGARYTNRSDLPGSVNGPQGQVIPAGGPLPVATAPGQAYGAASAQAAAQKIVPMGTPAAVSTAPSAGPAATPGGMPDFQLPPGAPLPGTLPPIDRMTERPNEPITHGAPVGPGGGPEVIPPRLIQPLVGAAAALNQLGDSAPPQVKSILASINASLGNQAAL
jgi:hypothetical protein